MSTLDEKSENKQSFSIDANSEARAYASAAAKMSEDAFGTASPLFTNYPELEAAEKDRIINDSFTNFQTLQTLASNSGDPKHAFTPAEIALSGSAAGFEEAYVEAQSIGQREGLGWLSNNGETESLNLLGNNLNQLTLGTPYAYQTSVNNETPEQVQADVIQNFSESGSAGVNQAQTGDCWFEATLASLASTKAGQEKIAKMIEQQPDESYNVNFGDGEKTNVTLSEINNRVANGDIGNSALWADIIESAFLKVDPSASNPNFASTAMSILVGNYGSVSDYSAGRQKFFQLLDNIRPAGGFSGELLTPQKNISEFQLIESQLNNGEAVVLASDPFDQGPDSPIIAGHGYSVLGIEAGNGTSSSFVEVRDPYGMNSKDSTDSEFVDVEKTLDGVTNLGGGVLLVSADKLENYLPVDDAVKP
jgi:hypothetical protein